MAGKQIKKAEEWVPIGHAQVVKWLRQVGRIMVTNQHGTPVTIYTGRAKCGPHAKEFYIGINGDRRIYSHHWGTAYLSDYQLLAMQAVRDKVKPDDDSWVRTAYQAHVAQAQPVRQVSSVDRKLITAVRAIEVALKVLNT